MCTPLVSIIKIMGIPCVSIQPQTTPPHMVRWVKYLPCFTLYIRKNGENYSSGRLNHSNQQQ